jgi:hypothetical protein
VLATRSIGVAFEGTLGYTLYEQVLGGQPQLLAPTYR